MEYGDYTGYGKYILDEFEFESGKILRDVQVEYSASGTPKFDDEGNIVNAIIYCHPFNKNYSSIGDLYKLTSDNGPFDFNEYYIISITSLGFPDSCSPSTTNLKYDFPKYTIKDRVNFKRQFIKEKFNIKKVLGVFGIGLGGYDTFTWACEYPDEMEFIVVFASSFKTNGYRYVVSKGIESIIDSSDDFYNEIYSDSLSRIMVAINKLLYSNYYSKGVFQNMSNDEIDVFMEDFVDDGLFVDIYDLKSRNDAILIYDVEDKLQNIKAKALIFGSDEDMYYSSQYDTLPLKDMIEDCEVILYNSNRDPFSGEEYFIMHDGLMEFMKNF